MDFTKINDPAGVQALLESLRRSQAFADSVGGPDGNNTAGASLSANASTNDVPRVESGLTGEENLKSEQPLDAALAAVTTPPSVASLLSQLQASSNMTSILHSHPPHMHTHTHTHAYAPPAVPSPYASLPVITPPRPSASPSTSVPSLAGTTVAVASDTTGSSVAPARKQDARTMTFQQALPHLAKMSEDAEFVEAVVKMKEEQDKLERQLMEERLEIQRKHQEKIKSARTKASMIGAGLSKHEAEMMSTAFRKELHKFDVERVMVAWDGLLAKQQMALEILAVPAMFSSSKSSDVEKQKKVMRVLEGIVAGDTES